jgi:hypothetical protein
MTALSRTLLFLSAVALHAATGGVITTNTVGEYFDPVANSALRYIYGQLSIDATSATLLIYPPPITTNGVEATVISAGLAHFVIKPVTVKKTFVEILADKKLSADIQFKAVPNFAAPAGYQLNLQLLGQYLNTNIFSTPNPVQYFMLQLFPQLLVYSGGITQPAYCDIYYDNKPTKKWILSSQNNFISQGLFLSQDWKTNLIALSKTNVATTLTFSLQIPATSFPNLQQGTYLMRIAAVMAPINSLSGLPATQIINLQKLYNNSAGLAVESDEPNAVTNLIYLNKQISDILAN